MLTTAGLDKPGTAGWLLAPLLLLVVRPALVLATMSPRFIDRRGHLFVGLFGVRGVAALFYAAVIVEAEVLSSGEQKIVVWTAIVCVITSVVARGLSATPLTRRLLGVHRRPGTSGARPQA